MTAPPCVLCDGPLTLPIAELWCPKCSSFIRAHDGCQPGVNSNSAEQWKKMREAHDFSHPHHGSECEWARDRTRYVAPWDKTIPREPYLNTDKPHVPGSTIPKMCPAGALRKP